MSSTKRVTLALGVVSLLLVALAAVGIPNLELARGQPFSLGETRAPFAGDSDGPIPNGDLLIIAFRGFIALVILLLIAYIIISLLTPEGRKRLLAEIVLLVTAFALIDFLSSIPRSFHPPSQEPASGEPSNLDRLIPSGPTAVFSPTPPTWLAVLVVFLAAVMVTILIFTGIRIMNRRKRIPKTILVKLAGEAQAALDSVQGGVDVDVAIIRCYQEMIRVVNEEQGIPREAAMTPREFEDVLTARGFPRASLHTLTEIFERVRYGDISAGKAEEKMALSALAEIASASRSMERSNEAG